MTAKELKSGKEVNYNKFVVGYDKKNKVYYARKHGSAGQIFTDYTFARLKEFISGSGGKLLKTKKTLSGTSKNGMEYHYLVSNKEYPTLKAANAKVATYKIAPKVFKVENYPNGKQSKRTIKVKGQPGRYTIL